jgi:hypothetical protein
MTAMDTALPPWRQLLVFGDHLAGGSPESLKARAPYTSRAGPEADAVLSRLLALMAASWLLSPAAMAQQALTCTSLQERYRVLAEQALQQEIRLLKAVRQRICPTLSLQVDEAQPDQSAAETIDFDALIRCRHRAEAELQATRAPLYRNRRQLAFYTGAGADLAKQADGLLVRSDQAGCP